MAAFLRDIKRFLTWQIVEDWLNQLKFALPLHYWLFSLIVQSAFNCFAKNHLKRLNAKPMLEKAPKKNFRKLRKLISKASANC